MHIPKPKLIFEKGFTIVELIVVISVISLLAAITVVGYGSWQSNALSTQIKSDLNAASSAMEDYRTFNNGYPDPVEGIPGSVIPSSGSVLTIDPGSTAESYCIDGTVATDETITFYIASETSKEGPKEGTCATRPGQLVPGAPSGLAITGSTTTTVSLSWSTATNSPTSYTTQCSTDAGFIVGLRTFTGPATNATVNSLPASATHYCRVNATNAVGTGAWSSVISTATTANSCSDTGQYGVYPVCYDYDSIPVGTSIQGYWAALPDGYLPEDGSAVSRTTYADLFALIGTTYGVGNGSTTFNLPDSEGRLTVNRNSTDSEFNTIGEKYGAKTHIMTLSELPSHSHRQYVTANSGGSAVRNDYAADANGGVYPQGLNGGGAGGGGARNNIQPSIVKKSAIKWRAPFGTTSQLAPGTSLDGFWSSAPTGYLIEDGSAVSRTTYAALFAVIGTTYGVGDGSTTFNLPDSRGRTKVNLNPSDTQFDTMGEEFGEKTHTMTVSEMPSHSHLQYVTANSGGGAVRNDYGADAAGGTYDQGINGGSAGGGQAQNVIQPSFVKVSVIKHAAASAPDEDASMRPGGSIVGYWSSAPTGYLMEDGSAVSRTTYAALFAAIGTTHGAGNGSTTFNLPDSRGRTAVNLNAADTEFDTIGEKFGAKTHVVTVAQMPSHSHAQYVTALSGGSAIRNDYRADASGGTYTQGINGGGAGGNAAMNIIQPSITVRFAIKF